MKPKIRKEVTTRRLQLTAPDMIAYRDSPRGGVEYVYEILNRERSRKARPGDREGEVDWGWTGDAHKARPLSPYWQRRLVWDCQQVGVTPHLLRVGATAPSPARAAFLQPRRAPLGKLLPSREDVRVATTRVKAEVAPRKVVYILAGAAAVAGVGLLGWLIYRWIRPRFTEGQGVYWHWVQDGQTHVTACVVVRVDSDQNGRFYDIACGENSTPQRYYEANAEAMAGLTEHP